MLGETLPVDSNLLYFLQRKGVKNSWLQTKGSKEASESRASLQGSNEQRLTYCLSSRKIKTCLKRFCGSGIQSKTFRVRAYNFWSSSPHPLLPLIPLPKHTLRFGTHATRVRFLIMRASIQIAPHDSLRNLHTKLYFQNINIYFR